MDLNNEQKLYQYKAPQLLSAKAIDYQELEQFLKNKQWNEANLLTYKLISKASGVKIEKDECLTLEKIKSFPCKDLLTIDRLWVYYSNGLYGFSVQKDIYIKCGGKLDFSYPSDEIWEKFGYHVAWASNGRWLYYPDPFFDNNFMRIKGHLPEGLMWDGCCNSWGCDGFMGGFVVLFFSRIATCEV